MGDNINERNNGFVSEILDYLSNQKDESDLYDVVIEVGNKEFKGHRLVLAATSGYFRGLFGSGMREDIEKTVRLEETTFSQQAVASVLEILYTGRITLTEDNVTDIWSAANQLEILFLLKECEKFVLSTITHENCVYIYQDAKLLDSKVVTEAAWDCIIEYFDDIVNSNDILTLEFTDIKQLVQSEQLKTISEDYIVELILRWVAFSHKTEQNNTASKIDASHRKLHLFDLLSSTRLCLVSDRCLLTTVKGNQYVQDNKDIEPLIDESLRYKLMLDRRHDFTSSRAIYRSTETFSNVIVWGNSLGLHFKQTHGSKKYFLDNNDQTVDSIKICGYGNSVFFATLSSKSFELRIYNNNLNTSVRHGQPLPTLKSVSALHSFLALGSYLYVITQGTNKRVLLSRYDPTTNVWSSFQINVLLGSVAASTTIDNAIIVLEKVSDSIVVKHLNTDTMNVTCLPGVEMDKNGSFVTFRKDNDAFVLQNNGILWHLSSVQGPPHITCKQETVLWCFERIVYGALLVNGELLIFGPSMHTSDQTDDIVWQISVPGVFDCIRNVSTTDEGQYQQTVLNVERLM